MTPNQRTSSRPGAIAPPLIFFLGLLSAALSRVFSEYSFVKGFFQGAGIALLVAAVYVIAKRRAALRRGPDADDGLWLPSRDGRPSTDQLRGEHSTDAADAL
jgi:hypothetical protein